MTPTIHDVARRADCSIKTVSRVINAQPHVRPALRERVEAAIAATGYAPNLNAQRLVKKRTGALCVLTSTSEYYLAPDVLASAIDLARSSDYDLLLHIDNDQPSSRKQLASLIAGRRLDGLIITPPCDTNPFLTELLNHHPLPHVFIDPFNRDNASPYVATDDLVGARDLTTHLLDIGHRRIAFLKGNPNLRASVDRLTGYTQALAQRGIPFDPKLAANAMGTFEGGYNAVRLYLSGGTRPTAFFCVNDHAALGVLFALQEMNVRVPRDISVCGFGNHPLGARVFPGLTTVHQPVQEMITAALRLLLSILGGGQPASPTLLPSALVLRGSSGSAPGA
ncbi:MAG: LacI family DNA-binding transcriptional regulator [Anaerolineae bacterium]|nr:LacI family DNA-binding transcriptional regulator [Anaerolineae bacterium]